MRFERPSWIEIERMCERLARKIRKSGFEPDLIVGIARGAWVPARILSDIFDNKNLASIGIVFYKGVYKTAKKPKLLYRLPFKVDGKRVLLVDDVADSGESLLLAKKELRKARQVKIATLHIKPWSKVKPDFYVESTDAWVVYPWERRETRKRLDSDKISYK